MNAKLTVCREVCVCALFIRYSLALFEYCWCWRCKRAVNIKYKNKFTVIKHVLISRNFLIFSCKYYSLRSGNYNWHLSDSQAAVNHIVGAKWIYFALTPPCTFHVYVEIPQIINSLTRKSGYVMETFVHHFSWSCTLGVVCVRKSVFA